MRAKKIPTSKLAGSRISFGRREEKPPESALITDSELNPCVAAKIIG